MENKFDVPENSATGWWDDVQEIVADCQESDGWRIRKLSDHSKTLVVTGFDLAYLDRGRTMIDSLISSGYKGDVVVADLFCELKDEFFDHPKVNVVRPKEMNEEIGEMLQSLANKNTSRAEVFFSVMPTVVLEFSTKLKSGDRIAYLDADLFFFDDFSAFLASTSRGATLVGHSHLPWNRSRLAKYGSSNVSMVVFSLDQDGIDLSRYWAVATRLWCRDQVEEGLYADQVYLDFFTLISDFVQVIEAPHINLAPWNSLKRKILFLNGAPTIDGRKVLFAHMQGIRFAHRTWLPLEYKYFSPVRKGMKELYSLYVSELAKNRLISNVQKTTIRGQNPNRAMVMALRFLGQTVSGSKP